eukprot:TRINITY_DN93706_c0_g1_i1.p1 TRINITY_DN93706_c0_g1~~TRINITY_DN93706_c0_g1_i1.p1  ORF type:complete len:241 (+),score=62.32 TRINITY_DN93706_c0_g1_i1:144-866(+)
MLRKSPWLLAGRGEPSPHVKRLASELLALPPKELEELRKMCRERLIPKPSFHKGKLPKDYNPVLKMKRSDQPLPVRSRLASMGRRLSGFHPAYVFAGSGPGIMPSLLPMLGPAIMGPHAMAMAPSSDQLAAAAVPIQAPRAAETPPAVDQEDAEAEHAVASKTQKKEELKASVTIRLLSFETSKKIAVVKEIRAMLGEGLKESKEKVESVPTNLKKNVPREEAEALAGKLRAAGAEVTLE